MAESDHEIIANGKRVLIVDDDRFITRVLKMKLEQEGFQVFTAHNGCEGLEQIKKHGPQVVITDLNMPKMGGWELCSRIKELPDAQPNIIITTSLIEREERERVKAFPNAKLIDKPVSPKEICTLVDDFFQQTVRREEQ